MGSRGGQDFALGLVWAPGKWDQFLRETRGQVRAVELGCHLRHAESKFL